jgi:hypothetical protein
MHTIALQTTRGGAGKSAITFFVAEFLASRRHLGILPPAVHVPNKRGCLTSSPKPFRRGA